MIAHVYDADLPIRRQAFRDDTPVSRRSEEAVRDQKRRRLRWISMDDSIQHGFS